MVRLLLHVACSVLVAAQSVMQRRQSFSLPGVVAVLFGSFWVPLEIL